MGTKLINKIKSFSYLTLKMKWDQASHFEIRVKHLNWFHFGITKSYIHTLAHTHAHTLKRMHTHTHTHKVEHFVKSWNKKNWWSVYQLQLSPFSPTINAIKVNSPLYIFPVNQLLIFLGESLRSHYKTQTARHWCSSLLISYAC